MMKRFSILLILVGLMPVILPSSGRATPPGLHCDVDADCFEVAVRALNRREVTSAHTLLLDLLEQYPNSPWAGRAALVLGRSLQERGDRQAVVYLLSAQRQLPILGDYAYFYLGAALFGVSEWNGSASAYDLLSARYPDSLLRPQALYRAAEAWFQGDDCRRARERQAMFLSTYPGHSLAPAVLLRQGDCEQKGGDRSAAIATYRRVWIQFAAASQATEAAFRLQALKDKGVALPEISAQDSWVRAKALFDAGQYGAAVPVLQELLSSPQGLPDRQQALLTLGIARIRLKQYDEARAVLAELVRNRIGAVSQEAALWLARVYLRQGREEPLLVLAADVDAGLLSGELKTRFLLLLAADYADRGRIAKAVSTYRRVAEMSGTNSTSAEVFWRIGWLHYNEGRHDEALRAFDESIRLLPGGPYFLQALYWKGRTLEKIGERQKAFETFRSICSEALNSYYCQISRTRNGGTDNGHVPLGGDRLLPEVPELPHSALEADVHYRRATELRLIRWHREAAEEFSVLTSRLGQDRTAALWLARLLNATGEYHRALYLVRTVFADIVERGGTTIGKTFWELAYPGGYAPMIRTLPGSEDIDVHLITAVIREESSYNPAAVSSAGAVGLMQVMPQTGQQIAPKLDAQGFTRDRLFDPCYNIRAGSWYLRHLGEKFGKNLVYVIAAYNAGPEVVSKWVQNSGHRDQDEFIETIPYLETRNYVKKVLRSYWEYKRIYGQEDGPPSLTSSGAPGIVRCEGGYVIE